MEFGIGVRVAATFAELPEERFAGAESCRVKLLVMVRFVDAVLEGSATLCAVTVTFGETGRIGGAV